MAEPRRTSANDASGRATSDLEGARILIVEARFYEDIADALLAGGGDAARAALSLVRLARRLAAGRP